MLFDYLREADRFDTRLQGANQDGLLSVHILESVNDLAVKVALND